MGTFWSLFQNHQVITGTVGCSSLPTEALLRCDKAMGPGGYGVFIYNGGLNWLGWFALIMAAIWLIFVIVISMNDDLGGIQKFGWILLAAVLTLPAVAVYMILLPEPAASEPRFPGGSRRGP